MAKEDDLDLDVEGADEEEPKKSKSKLLIIIAVVVLFLGVSATATLVLTGMLSGEADEVAAEDAGDEKQASAKKDKKNKKNKEKNKKDKKNAKSKAPLNYIALDPAFVVNFTNESEIRFLQISIEAGTRDPDVIEKIKEHRPAIRNSLVMLFSGQDAPSLNTRDGKESLRKQTLAEIKKVLKQETGETGVENVFFTSFVMQ